MKVHQEQQNQQPFQFQQIHVFHFYQQKQQHLMQRQLMPHSVSFYNQHKRDSQQKAQNSNCLLYTSDAADEEDSVNLGGRRIIKKKKKKKKKKKIYDQNKNIKKIKNK
eukprot:TRINITY_DN1758_c0_g1_i7.p2 TRINITY_DN1758_c0_g1~~TRINITY_DN1758_c0_g1_i7.p2  ORF type:complete len:108 (+),score=16.41 TRINITY_DN1758_c0_g1_i7:271-594(+)